MNSEVSGRRPPVFLVGMPRSGTKLLRDLLNRHPLVGIPEAETEVLPDWAARWPSFGNLARPEVWLSFVRQVEGSAYFVYLREERGIKVDAVSWRAACPDLSMAGVFEGLCRLHGGAPDEGIWGDKSPGYLRHIDLLWRLWPDAHIVHLVRDPRDQALSAAKAWGKDIVRGAARWADSVDQAERWLSARPQQAHLLRYEDLISDPAASLRRLCLFLDIPFVDDLTHLSRPSENLGATAGETRVVADNAEKWRDEMPAATCQRIEALCADGLRRYGYPCSYAGPQAHLSRNERRLRQLKDGFHLVQFDVKQRGALGAVAFRWRLFAETGGWE